MISFYLLSLPFLFSSHYVSQWKGYVLVTALFIFGFLSGKDFYQNAIFPFAPIIPQLHFFIWTIYFTTFCFFQLCFFLRTTYFSFLFIIKLFMIFHCNDLFRLAIYFCFCFVFLPLCFSITMIYFCSLSFTSAYSKG